MKAFKDSTGREWRIRITLGVINDILELHGVDLLDLTAPDDEGVPLLTRLRTDMRLLGKVLGECLETNGDRPLERDELEEAFDGKTKVAAWLALKDELDDFFTDRPDVGEAIRKHEEMMEALIAYNSNRVKNVSVDIEGLIDSAEKSGN